MCAYSGEKRQTPWGSPGMIPRGCSTLDGAERWKDFCLTEKNIPARENDLCEGTEDCEAGGLGWMVGRVQ